MPIDLPSLRDLKREASSQVGIEVQRYTNKIVSQKNMEISRLKPLKINIPVFGPTNLTRKIKDSPNSLRKTNINPKSPLLLKLGETVQTNSKKVLEFFLFDEFDEDTVPTHKETTDQRRSRIRKRTRKIIMSELDQKNLSNDSRGLRHLLPDSAAHTEEAISKESSTSANDHDLKVYYKRLATLRQYRGIVDDNYDADLPTLACILDDKILKLEMKVDEITEKKTNDE